jgi:hypothetical protein
MHSSMEKTQNCIFVRDRFVMLVKLKSRTLKTIVKMQDGIMTKGNNIERNLNFSFNSQ